MFRIILSFMVLTLVSCSSGYKPTTNDKGQVVVRIGLNTSNYGSTPASLNKFFSLINEKTDDAYEFQIFFDAQLGEQKEVLELVRVNGLEMGFANTAMLETYVPVFGAFAQPYLFNGDEHTTAVVSSEEVFNKLKEASLPQKFIPIMILDNLPRSFFGHKPYINPGDLKGAKVRIINSPAYVAIVEALDANPTPLAFTEQYTSFQSGIIDAAESGAGIFHNTRLGEVVKHFTYTDTVRFSDIVYTSVGFWESLSPEHQQIFTESSKEVVRNFHMSNAYALMDLDIQESIKMGVQYHQGDIEAYRKILSPITEEWANKTPENREFVDLIKSFE